MARGPSFRKRGKVSLWLGVRKPDLAALEDVDILTQLCGVGHYDLDQQEVSAVDASFPRAPVAEIIDGLSYSRSFHDAALRIIGEMKIRHAYWALAQYDFAYDPSRVRAEVAAEPRFLGAFDWEDAEDDRP